VLDIHLPDREIKSFVSQKVSGIRGEPVVSTADEPVLREDVLCVAQPAAPRSKGAAGTKRSTILANPDEFSAVVLERKIKQLWKKSSELVMQANRLSKAAKKSSGKDHTVLMLVAATGSGHNVVSGRRSTSEYGTPLTSAVMPSPASRRVLVRQMTTLLVTVADPDRAMQRTFQHAIDEMDVEPTDRERVEILCDDKHLDSSWMVAASTDQVAAERASIPTSQGVNDSAMVLFGL
jgi:hypothetical protein